MQYGRKHRRRRARHAEAYVNVPRPKARAVQSHSLHVSRILEAVVASLHSVSFAQPASDHLYRSKERADRK